MNYSRYSARARTIALLVGLSVLPAGVIAQESENETFGFTSTRYSNTTADFIFTGYGSRNVFGMLGLVLNPRSGYSEVLGGVGIRFALGSTNHAVALTYAEATDSPYTQIYFLPSVTLGATNVEATFQLYMPSASRGVWQFGLNPLSVFTEVAGPVSVGGSYQLNTQERGLPQHLAGPAFRLILPRGVLTLDLLNGIKRSQNEIRASFRAGF
jgi:hypothetical protein